MLGPTHEQTINAALGETLGNLRNSWTVRFEELGALDGGGRADIIIEDASGWPVVIEAERANYASAETDARSRLGKKTNGRPIETAIALVYPDELTWLDGQPLRSGIRSSRDLEYALYTRRPNDQPPERLPEDGWIKGSVLNLAMLVQRATLPAPRIEALAFSFEAGVDLAANELARRHPYGAELAAKIATTLGQADDPNGQTRRMAMTVVANALVFHESLAEASFQVPEDPNAPENSPADEDAPRHSIRSVSAFRPGGRFTADELCLEWERILKVNYWPIFWTAKEIVSRMPAQTSHAILGALWRTAQQLVAGGVTRSHDLMGVVFQKLIADRKFLATYYTRPEAAALLAGLALPTHRPPGGSDWADADTLAGVQIGDFACGTGTLLSAAYHRMSLLHELHGGDAEALHAPMMKHGLVGLDVLPMAVHLTAAMLAGSRPATPFDGECLLTMPYGDIPSTVPLDDQPSGPVAVGSLDLLAEHVQPSLIDKAAAVMSGAREPEEVSDLVSRVGHREFDLVIMNPPFTRPTNHEASHADVPIPAYAAFEKTHREQEAMSARVKTLTRGAPSNDYAGLASHFAELASRKARNDGTIALVLPLSAMSGISWNDARAAWREKYEDITVVTIAGAGSDEASFSADTGMAECLLIARRDPDLPQHRATFAILNRQTRSTQEAELLAAEITRMRADGAVGAIEDGEFQPIKIGSGAETTAP